jgi:hypothetical protein
MHCIKGGMIAICWTIISEMPPESVDLVLVLEFPEPKIREDEQGRVYAQLM